MQIIGLDPGTPRILNIKVFTVYFDPVDRETKEDKNSSKQLQSVGLGPGSPRVLSMKVLSVHFDPVDRKRKAEKKKTVPNSCRF